MGDEMSYNTFTRTKINEYLESRRDITVTVSDISEYLKSCGCEVNVTTIYRYIDKLITDKKVIKYVDEKGKKATFQYVGVDNHCDSHLHLKCVKCGKVEHLECEFMDKIAGHIDKEHGFEIQCRNSVIYGICEKCRK